MNPKNYSFILVNALAYTQIEALIDRYNANEEDAIAKLIDSIADTGKVSETNPIPDKNASGIFWNHNLILREGL